MPAESSAPKLDGFGNSPLWPAEDNEEAEALWGFGNPENEAEDDAGLGDAQADGGDDVDADRGDNDAANAEEPAGAAVTSPADKNSAADKNPSAETSPADSCFYKTKDDADAILSCARCLYQTATKLHVEHQMRKQGILRHSLELTLIAQGIHGKNAGVRSLMAGEENPPELLKDLVKELGCFALPILQRRWLGSLSPEATFSLLSLICDGGWERHGAFSFIFGIACSCLRYGSWMDPSAQKGAANLCCLGLKAQNVLQLASILIKVVNSGSDVCYEVLFRVAALLALSPEGRNKPKVCQGCNIHELDAALPLKERLHQAVLVATHGIVSLERGRFPLHDAGDRSRSSNFVRCSNGEEWLQLLEFVVCQVARFGSKANVHTLVEALCKDIENPYTLHQLAVLFADGKARRFRSKMHLAFQEEPIRSLVSTCLSLYEKLFDVKYKSPKKDDVDDMVAVLVHCRGAFHMIPKGRSRFWDLVHSLEKKHSKVKGFEKLVRKCIYPHSSTAEGDPVDKLPAAGRPPTTVLF